MSVIPLEKVKAITKSPRKILIYSPPKTGKTTLLSALDGCLMIDLERGSGFVDGFKTSANTCEELFAICQEHVKMGRPYKYVGLDTTTALEQMCLPVALKLYQGTVMGANYKGPILNLPNGAGYLYLRQAYDLILTEVEKSFDRVILMGHIKDKLIEKAGKEVSAKDIDLTGRLKAITCAGADAIGYLYRDGNKNILNFETTEEIICGARPVHLRNKKITISEYDPSTDTVTTYWSKIYID